LQLVRNYLTNKKAIAARTLSKSISVLSLLHCVPFSKSWKIVLVEIVAAALILWVYDPASYLGLPSIHFLLGNKGILF
jgi:hypothetical protein